MNTQTWNPNEPHTIGEIAARYTKEVIDECEDRSAIHAAVNELDKLMACRENDAREKEQTDRMKRIMWMRMSLTEVTQAYSTQNLLGGE